MAFLGKKMGNNHLHYIQTIFISKKHFRAGENFVVFLLVSNHNCNQFCNIVGAYFRQAPMWYFLSQPLSIFQNTLLLWQGIFSRSDAKISSWYKTALLLKFTIQAHSHVSLLFYCCFVNCDAFFDRTVSLSYWHKNICMQVFTQISVPTNSSFENILLLQHKIQNIKIGNSYANSTPIMK